MNYIGNFKGGPLHNTMRDISSPEQELYFPLLPNEDYSQVPTPTPTPHTHAAEYHLRKLVNDADPDLIHAYYEIADVICPSGQQAKNDCHQAGE